MRVLALCLLVLVTLVPAGAAPPAVMLAVDQRADAPLAVGEYLVSEKLDGVRGRWDGRALWTRGGHRVELPAWFTRGWPGDALDGELWMGRGRFDAVSALVRKAEPVDPRWRETRFMVFDLPQAGAAFADRARRIETLVAAAGNDRLAAVAQRRFADRAALDAHFRAVVAGGGEGLMLHRADGRYATGRSDALRKLKPFDDAEARVVAYAPGKGKYAGQVGALVVAMPDGRTFRLGSGLSDAQRAAPPGIGSRVTYRHTGLTSTGLPRFARFLRVRDEGPPRDDG